MKKKQTKNINLKLKNKFIVKYVNKIGGKYEKER